MSVARPPPQPRVAPAASGNSQFEWLSRLTQDVHDQATPIGAFLAMLPQAPKRRAKSSSERGKAFRERQRQQEEELEKRIGLLKRDIAILDMQRKTRETRCLNTRTSPTGSLAQAVVEYHRLFRHGLVQLPDEPSRVGVKRVALDANVVRQVQLQESFLRRIMDPTVIVAESMGPEASLVQWRRYTESHASITLDVQSIQVIATDDENHDDGDELVTVVANCLLRATFSRASFQNMFPHVLGNDAFMARMVGKEITYSVVRSLQFGQDGVFKVERVEVDFVGGLVNAGVSLADIAVLMGRAAISTGCMIVEVDQDTEQQEQDTQVTSLVDSCTVDQPDSYDASPPDSGGHNRTTEPVLARVEIVDDEVVEDDNDAKPTATTSTATRPSSRLSMVFLLSDTSAA